MSKSGWMLRYQHTPDSGHHKFWVVFYHGRRVAVYLKWARALDHVFTAHSRC
jgi:hypothetical protein